MTCRPHFTYAVYGITRFWWLWLFPLWRLVTAKPLPLREWLPIAVLLLYTTLRFFRCRYRLCESKDGNFHSVEVRQGIWLRHTTHLCAEDAASVEVECTPLLWVFGGRRVRISTTGLRRRADVLLYLSRSDANRLFVTEPSTPRLRGSVWRTVVFAMSGSNAAVGLLSVSPLLRQMARSLRDFITQTVTDTTGNTVWSTLPPLLQTGGVLLLAGWAFSATRTFLRYVGFSATRTDDHLCLRSGWVTHRDIRIDCDKVMAFEVRQTLMMRILQVYTAVVTAAGYGRDVGARPVLIASADRDTLSRERHRLLPPFSDTPHDILPCRAPLSYVGMPLLAFAVWCVTVLYGVWWRPLSIFGLFLCAWWLLVRILGFRQAGYGQSDTVTQLHYPRGLALHRVTVLNRAVDCLTVIRNPWQRYRGLCTIRVRCFGEKHRRHTVKGISYEKWQKKNTLL